MQPSTIKKHITSLAEAAPFVNSTYCPHHTNHSKTYMQQLDKWYTNTINKLQAQVTSYKHKGANTTGNLTITLTEVWDETLAEWEAFWQEVRVGGRASVGCGLSVCGVHVGKPPLMPCPPMPLPPPPLLCAAGDGWQQGHPRAVL